MRARRLRRLLLLVGLAGALLTGPACTGGSSGCAVGAGVIYCNK